MNYSLLAQFYDEIMSIDSEIDAWIKYFKPWIGSGPILELACGTGEITKRLLDINTDIMATDISIDMLNQAKEKLPDSSISWKQLDMVEFDCSQTFKTIICACDSIHYCHDVDQLSSMLKCVYQHLEGDGFFLFDAHTTSRLYQFQKNPYYEEGVINSVGYSWEIDADETSIIHQVAIYNQTYPHIEVHTQRVFTPQQWMETLSKQGYTYSIMTDYHKEGFAVGEKWYFICQKETKK